MTTWTAKRAIFRRRRVGVAVARVGVEDLIETGERWHS